MNNLVRKDEAELRMLCAWRAVLASAGNSTALHLGYGSERRPGFIHVDGDSSVPCDFSADLNRGLSFAAAASFDFLYSEQLWDRFPLMVGQMLAGEAARILRPGGRIRIATLDLDVLMHRYSFDWRAQTWLEEEPWKSRIHSRGEMLNAAFLGRGHCYLYNEEDLRTLLRTAGFSRIVRFRPGCSSERKFWNLEVRNDSLLILEGVKG